MILRARKKDAEDRQRKRPVLVRRTEVRDQDPTANDAPDLVRKAARDREETGADKTPIRKVAVPALKNAEGRQEVENLFAENDLHDRLPILHQAEQLPATTKEEACLLHFSKLQQK